MGLPFPWASYAIGVSYGNRGSNILGVPEKNPRTKILDNRLPMAVAGCQCRLPVAGLTKNVYYHIIIIIILIIILYMCVCVCIHIYFQK